MFAKYVGDDRAIVDTRAYKWNTGRDCLGMAGREIVQYNDRLPIVEQCTNGVAPDVSCPAADEDPTHALPSDRVVGEAMLLHLLRLIDVAAVEDDR